MSAFMRGISHTAVGFGWWFCGALVPMYDSSTYDGSAMRGRSVDVRRAKAVEALTPQRTRDAHAERLRSGIVGRGVGAVVVVDVCVLVSGRA
jgi:hypothetical protein